MRRFVLQRFHASAPTARRALFKQSAQRVSPQHVAPTSFRMQLRAETVSLPAGPGQVNDGLAWMPQGAVGEQRASMAETRQRRCTR